MAQEKRSAADKDATPGEGAGAPQPTLSQGAPELEVEALENVQGFLEGKQIEKGKTYWLHATEATGALARNEVKLTGRSRTP